MRSAFSSTGRSTILPSTAMAAPEAFFAAMRTLSAQASSSAVGEKQSFTSGTWRG